MVFKTILIIALSYTLYAQDFVVNTNDNYTRSRIKSLANNGYSRHGRTCYIYVDINGNRDWRRYHNRLNTQIRSSTKCKKFIIYKIVQNVKTYRRYGNSNNNSGEYKINLGAIVKENANVDIKIYTIVKNSTLKEGVFSKQKVNTGIVVEGDQDIDNKKYITHTNIKNSEIGKQNTIQEYGLDLAKDFLKKDKDDPLN